MPAVTYEELTELCEYDAELGAFRWKKDMGPGGRIKAGTLVATRMADGGKYMTVNHNPGRLSTLVWLYHHGEMPSERLVPVDGDYTNDRIENLRLASQAVAEGIGHHGTKSTRDMTAELVRDIFDYDPVDGVLTWRKKVAQSTVIGRIAGSPGNHGHWSISLGKRDYLRSRLVWLYHNDAQPRAKLVHLNGNKTDDRIENLAESAFTHGDFDLRTREGRNEYGRIHRKNHRHLYRAKQLKRDFGITLADYERMFAEQDGKCAICHRPERLHRWGKEMPLAVDHDHGTGKVRGLLCSDCNQGIGRFQDKIEWLQSAIDYLRQHSGQSVSDWAVIMRAAYPETRASYQ